MQPQDLLFSLVLLFRLDLILVFVVFFGVIAFAIMFVVRGDVLKMVETLVDRRQRGILDILTPEFELLRSVVVAFEATCQLSKKLSPR